MTKYLEDYLFLKQKKTGDMQQLSSVNLKPLGNNHYLIRH